MFQIISSNFKLYVFIFSWSFRGGVLISGNGSLSLTSNLLGLFFLSDKGRVEKISLIQNQDHPLLCIQHQTFNLHWRAAIQLAFTKIFKQQNFNSSKNIQGPITHMRVESTGMLTSLYRPLFFFKIDHDAFDGESG